MRKQQIEIARFDLLFLYAVYNNYLLLYDYYVKMFLP